jgi:hypothetical protein
VLGLSCSAFAETNSTDADLRAEMEALKAEIAQLKQGQDDTWLNERRAEEVKTLIRDVLADADTRASLLQDGMYAGHDGKNFFLASADGNFLMNISGQVQFRYYAQIQDERTKSIDDDDNDDDDITSGSETNDLESQTGFQLRRAKVKFSGHVINPNFFYTVGLASDRDDGDVFAEDVIVGYKVSDELSVQGGVFKLPFLRQELISSTSQMVMERGIVTEFFTLDRAEQIMATYSTDLWQASASFNDGARGDSRGYTDFGSEAAHFGATGRFDFMVFGEWGQWKDISSWSGQDDSLFIGAALHYEEGERTNGFTTDYIAWTIDASWTMAGLSVYGAYMGGSTEADTGADRDMNGILIEAGYMVIPDELQPYIRWEFLDPDDGSEDELQAITFGLNYFLDKHNAKFTTDFVIVYDGDVPSSNPFGASATSSGLGLSDAGSFGDETLFVWRAQFQLLF